MKKLAWSAAIVVTAGVALGIGQSACTVTSSSGGDDGGIVFGNDSGGNPDTSTGGQDTGTGSDTGTGGDTGSVTDSGGGGDGAVTCEVPDGSSTCDTCLLTSCCSQETACTSEPTNDDGLTDCEEIAGCFNDCITGNPDAGVDAGTPSDCAMLCESGHTQQGKDDFNALENCGAQNCLTQCM